MIIDLNDTHTLQFAETDYELTQLKSNKLILEINKHTIKTNQNFMIVPMSIYNLIETNNAFKFAKLESLMGEEPLRHMGSLYGIEVYLDLFAPSDTVILKYDKSIMRDKKIDALLQNKSLQEDTEITVLNY